MLFYPFTFTGKERDAETGYSYFGARYYDSDLSGLFLSVDPMSDKYPSISPYAYCAWNPLKLVDPDGNEVDDYKLNTKDGSLIKIRITSDKNDAIFVDNNPNASFYTDKGILNGKMGENISKKGFDADDGKQKQGVELMYFISTTIHVELSGWGYKDQHGKEGIYIEPWNNNTVSSSRVNGFIGRTTTQRRHRQFHLHIHPGLPNGNGGQGRPSKNDYEKAEKYGGAFFIISKHDGLTRFSSDGKNNRYWYPSRNRVPRSLRQFIKN